MSIRKELDKLADAHKSIERLCDELKWTLQPSNGREWIATKSTKWLGRLKAKGMSADEFKAAIDRCGREIEAEKKK